MTFEQNPQFAQVAPASETAVVMFLEISVRNTTFPINICFPYYVLDPIIQKLVADNWLGLALMNKTDDDRMRAEWSLKQSELLLRICLGETTVTVQELMDLEANDVLILNSKIEKPLKVMVGEKPRFLGSIGKLGKKLALRIEEVVEEDDDKKTEERSVA